LYEVKTKEVSGIGVVGDPLQGHQDNINSLIVSPDGKNVYSLSNNFYQDGTLELGNCINGPEFCRASSELVYWKRDLDTGELSNKVVLVDKVNIGTGGDEQNRPTTINRLKISPDSKNIYVLVADDDTSSRTDRKAGPHWVYWDRDLTTGALTNQVVLNVRPNGIGNWNPIHSPLGSGDQGDETHNFQVEISPEGNHIYVIIGNKNGVFRLQRWERNINTGALTSPTEANPASTIIWDQGCIGNANLDLRAFLFTISPNGNDLYTLGGSVRCGQQSPGITHFKRNTVTGELSKKEESAAVSDLVGSLQIVISPEGNTVYVTLAEAILFWNRNKISKSFF